MWVNNIINHTAMQNVYQSQRNRRSFTAQRSVHRLEECWSFFILLFCAIQIRVGKKSADGEPESKRASKQTNIGDLSTILEIIEFWMSSTCRIVRFERKSDRLKCFCSSISRLNLQTFKCSCCSDDKMKSLSLFPTNCWNKDTTALSLHRHN